jgi:hypothetical protein
MPKRGKDNTQRCNVNCCKATTLGEQLQCANVGVTEMPSGNVHHQRAALSRPAFATGAWWKGPISF